MSEKRKNVCMTLNYIENLLILTSAVTGCVSISAFDKTIKQKPSKN